MTKSSVVAAIADRTTYGITTDRCLE